MIRKLQFLDWEKLGKEEKWKRFYSCTGDEWGDGVWHGEAEVEWESSGISGWN